MDLVGNLNYSVALRIGSGFGFFKKHINFWNNAWYYVIKIFIDVNVNPLLPHMRYCGVVTYVLSECRRSSHPLATTATYFYPQTASSLLKSLDVSRRDTK